MRIECEKEKGKEHTDNDEETTPKIDDKVKEKVKSSLKGKDNKNKKKETQTCNHCGMKGHIKVKCWKKDPSQMPEKFKGKKTEKEGAAVEVEHLLSTINICDDISNMQVNIEVAYVSAPIVSIDNGFGNVNDYGDILGSETPTECDDIGYGASLGGSKSNVFNPTLRLFSHTCLISLILVYIRRVTTTR